MATLSSMEASGWCLISATVMGPIAAVQAQKWIERWSEHRKRKTAIFVTLMATRQERLSARHVEALNSIEFAFHGSRRFLAPWIFAPTAGEQLVLSRWDEYFRHFNRPAATEPQARAAELARAEVLFTNLLESIAAERRFTIERSRIELGSYMPSGPLAREAFNDRLRIASMQIAEFILSEITRYQQGRHTAPPPTPETPVDAQ